MLYYRLSLHPALILTAVTEDPFDKSVSASAHWQAQPIGVQLVLYYQRQISSLWMDCPQMSKPWLYLKKKKANHM